MDGKAGGGKSIKNPVKIVRSEVETKTKSKIQNEKSRGQGNILKLGLEAEKSVAGVGNSKQGVGKLDNGNSKNICEGVGVMGNSLNNMMECNDECVILLEKKKTRVLPNWILEGGKRSEPPDTEKINSAGAEKNDSLIIDLIQKDEVKMEEEKKQLQKG